MTSRPIPRRTTANASERYSDTGEVVALHAEAEARIPLAASVVHEVLQQGSSRP